MNAAAKEKGAAVSAAAEGTAAEGTHVRVARVD